MILLSSRLQYLLPVYLTVFFYSIASSATLTGPVMPLYVKSLGISVVGWSLLAASLSLGMFFAEWVWGSLGDRIDRRLLMLISVFSLGTFSLLYTIDQLVPAFLILMFATGTLIVAIGPLTRSYVSTGTPKRSIGFYTSLWWAFFVLGRIVGPLLGTYVAQTWNFRYSFWATSTIAFTLAVFMLVSFPNERRKRQPASQSMVGNLRVLFKKRSSKFLFLSAMFYFMAPTMTLTFLPLYAAQQVNMSTIEVGVLIATVSCVELISMPIVGWVSDRYGRKRTVIVGLLASSCLFLLYFIANTAPLVLIVSMGIGVGFSGTAILLAMVPDVTPTALLGAAIGVYGSFEDLGSIIAPLLYGFVWSTFGPVYIFAVASATQLVGAILVSSISSAAARPT